MDPANLELARTLVSASYVGQGGQALAARHRLVKALLSSRRMPEEGWDEASIEGFIADCSLMDSNNFLNNVGVGEREARVACPLVARRHMRLAHGIGRSGDIAAEQPKAAGSSLLAKLATLLSADALRIAGFGDLGAVTLLPLATGLAMTLTLRAITAKRPESAKTVLWSRVDQKTCLKAIQAAGLHVRVIDLELHGDELKANLGSLEAAIKELGEEGVAAVMSTTSCFAPRACDDVVSIAKLCSAHGIPHMINNAYGVQSANICKTITSAWRKGRVDAVVQSTDKNFMVPVGGALVCESKARPGAVEAINKAYPGRASISCHLDMLMTLLHWGAAGWRKVLSDRESLFPILQSTLTEAAALCDQRVLVTPGNPISLGVTLDLGVTGGGRKSDLSFVGAMLWARLVSGARVAGTGKGQVVGGIKFENYGAHFDSYPHTYLTAAAAVGGSVAEVKEVGVRLVKVLQEVAVKREKEKKKGADAAKDAFVMEGNGIGAEREDGQQDGKRNDRAS